MKVWPLNTTRSVIFGVLLVSAAFAKGHQPHPLIVKIEKVEALLGKVEQGIVLQPELMRWDVSGKRFKNPDIEQARALLRELDGALAQASDGLQSMMDRRLKVIAPVAIKYMIALGRVLSLYARSIHMPVSGTTLTPDLSAYSFDQVDTNLVLGKRAALVVIAAMADLQFPVKARHFQNGTGAKREQIELILTEEQKQAAEFAALSTSPQEQAKAERERIQSEKDYKDLFVGGASGAPGAQEGGLVSMGAPPYSFSSPEAYAKLIQFGAVRETLVNRWALNRMLPKSVASRPVASCGKQILSLRPGSDGLMASSSAYSELAAVDRYKSFLNTAPVIAEVAGKQTLVDSNTYGQIVLAVVKKIPGVDPAQTQYVSEHLVEIGAKVTQDEQSLWTPRALDIILNSSLNGEDFSAEATSARISSQVFEYRVDAVQKAIWENLKVSFPAANRYSSDSIVESALNEKRASYIARVKAQIDPLARQLEAGTNSPEMRKKRFAAKSELILKSAKASVQAAAELDYMIESEVESDDESPTTANYRTQIDDPLTLRLYFKVLEQMHIGALRQNPGREAGKMIDEFFSAVDKRFVAGIPQGKAVPANLLAKAVSEEAKLLWSKYPPAKYAPTKPGGASKSALLRDEEFFKQKYAIQKDNTRVVPRPRPANISAQEAVGILLTSLNINTKTFVIASNRQFTSKLFQHRSLLELMTMNAYNGSPALRLRFKAERTATPAPLEDQDPYAFNHGVVQYKTTSGLLYYKSDLTKERSLIENIAVGAFDMKSGVLNEAKTKQMVVTALSQAGVNGAQLVERFCSANPIKYKTDPEYRNLFRAASALRSSITGGSFALKKLDEEMQRETRSFNEKVLEDIIDPIMKVVAVIAIIMALIASGGWLATTFAILPGLAAFSTAFFAASAITAVNYGLLAVTAANLYVTVNVNVIELPPQIGFQSRLGNTQIGETQSIMNWDQHLAEKDMLGVRQAIMVVTVPLDLFFIGQSVRRGMIALAERTVLNSSSKLYMPKLSGSGSATRNSTSLVAQERGFLPIATRPTTTALQAATGSRLLEFRKLLMTVLPAGSETRIASMLEPYMESAVNGLRREIEFYRSVMKPEFWEKAIAEQGTARLGKLPRAASSAARKGELQSWYDSSWGDLRPSLETHVTDLESALQRLEGLHTKTKSLFLNPFEGNRIKNWAEAMTDDEIKALRGLMAQESVYGYHLPSLSAEDDALRNQLFDQFNQGFKRAHFEFAAEAKPSAASLYEGYWGQPPLQNLDRSIIRSDLSDYQRWLTSVTPSL